MTVDLKWHEAIAIAQSQFQRAECVTGWPECMTTGQLTALQRPYVKGDTASNKLRQAFFRAIAQAVESGELVHEIRDRVFPIFKLLKTHYPRHTSLGPIWEEGVLQVREEETVQSPFVSAAPFAEWLRTQGEEPSQHIAHWFKVRGVAAPAVLQLAPTAPAVDAVVKPADSPPKLPTTWAELVKYHKANAGHTWTVELKNIVATEKNRRADALHKGVAKAMAGELGVTVTMLNTLIAKKDEIGSRKTVANRRTGT